MPFFLCGHGQHGRVIAPEIFTVVLVHGLAIAAWYGLSLVQSLLIATRNHRVHMKLGWSAVGIAFVVAVSGVMVAIRSVQATPDFVFYGMVYSDFLLVMFAEVLVYTIFVAVALWKRKRSQVHRPMMLLASLSLLLGATSRMPFLESIFPGHALLTFFGPVFALAALLLLVHSVLTRSFDRWFAAGYAFMVATYLGAELLSRTDWWGHLASGLIAT